jgi:hypothetical protein
MPELPATPTLDRRNAVAAESREIGEFLDWLSAQGIVLGRWGHEMFTVERWAAPKRYRGPDWEHLPDPRPSYREWNHEEITYPGTEDLIMPIGEGPDALLHRYFDIDPVAEEAELRALLEHVRAHND